MKNVRLVLFDMDSTLTESISGEKFPRTVEDRKFMTGRREKLLYLHAIGKKMAIVTNQGGAAWKMFTREDMDAFLERLCKSVGIEKYFVCYHDTGDRARQYVVSRPEQFIAELVSPDLTADGWERRKPGPGMPIEAMLYFGVDRHDTLMVGDRPEDQKAAEAAGTDFMWSWDYFKDGPIIA